MCCRAKRGTTEARRDAPRGAGSQGEGAEKRELLHGCPYKQSCRGAEEPGRYDEAGDAHPGGSRLQEEKVLGRVEVPRRLASKSQSRTCAARSKEGTTRLQAAMHREALALYLKVLGRENPSKPNSMENLAPSYYGEPEASLASDDCMPRGACSLREDAAREENPHTLTSICNLGPFLLECQGRYDRG